MCVRVCERERESLCVCQLVGLCVSRSMQVSFVCALTHRLLIRSPSSFSPSFSLCCECAYLFHPCHCVFIQCTSISLSNTHTHTLCTTFLFKYTIYSLSSFSIKQILTLNTVSSETCHIPLCISATPLSPQKVNCVRKPRCYLSYI